MTVIYNSLNYIALLNDAIIGREAVSGGSEFHAASSDVKESPYFLKL